MDKMTPDSESPFLQHLTTNRFILKPLMEEDAEDLFVLRSDFRVNTFIRRLVPETLKDVTDFILKVRLGMKEGTHCYWTIRFHNQSGLIGTICLFNFSDHGKSAELGFELLPTWWRQGIMTECAKEVLRFAVEEKQLETVLAFTQPDNFRTVPLLTKLGFLKTQKMKDGYQIFSLDAE